MKGDGEGREGGGWVTQQVEQGNQEFSVDLAQRKGTDPHVLHVLQRHQVQGARE